MKITLPELGEGISSAKVVDILVSEGDTIEKDDEVIEVETDKAVAGVPSTAAGKVSRIHVSTGDEISVGDTLVEVEESGEDGEEESDSNGQSDEESQAKEKEEEDKDEEKDASGNGEQEESEEKAESESDREEADARDSRSAGRAGGAPASPDLRRMARELGIDLRRVRGSGRGGRIEADDIRSYVEKLQRAVFEEGEGHGLGEDLSAFGPIHSEDLPGIRKTISNRLLRRWRSSPLVTQFGEAGMERILALKNRYESDFEERETRLTVTSFLIWALVPILEKYPKFNAAIDLDAERIIYRNYLHVGVAVATEHGLMVPVIRDVDQLAPVDLAKSLEELSGKAREGKLTADEMQGAGFYISNQGAIGGGHFTPLLSGSESAILGVGKGQLRVVERNESFKSVPTIPLSLSYDHRLIDGAEAATFMKDLEEALTDFDEKLLKNATKSG